MEEEEEDDDDDVIIMNVVSSRQKGRRKVAKRLSGAGVGGRRVKVLSEEQLLDHVLRLQDACLRATFKIIPSDSGDFSTVLVRIYLVAIDSPHLQHVRATIEELQSGTASSMRSALMSVVRRDLSEWHGQVREGEAKPPLMMGDASSFSLITAVRLLTARFGFQDRSSIHDLFHNIPSPPCDIASLVTLYDVDTPSGARISGALKKDAPPGMKTPL